MIRPLIAAAQPIAGQQPPQPRYRYLLPLVFS